MTASPWLKYLFMAVELSLFLFAFLALFLGLASQLVTDDGPTHLAFFFGFYFWYCSHKALVLLRNRPAASAVFAFLFLFAFFVEAALDFTTYDRHGHGSLFLYLIRACPIEVYEAAAIGALISTVTSFTVTTGKQGHQPPPPPAA